jgi:nucleoside-diphosphate-sugar epimerase
MDKKILVTGGTGYIASWVIKFLLEKGYVVHTTVRDKKNVEKSRHLVKMAEELPGELKFYEADLLEEGSFDDAMEGVDILIHMASPFFISGIKDAKKQLIDPALQGTRNVLNTAKNKSSVKRVVLTSSVAAVHGDNIDLKETEKDVFTEENWNTTSNLKHQPYSYSKTLAEQEAWKISKSQEQWDLVVINPGFVLGPSLSKRKDSTSIDFMVSLLKGKFKAGVPELFFGAVDVRDVAMAHVKAALKDNAKGRHILVSKTMSIVDMAKTIKKDYNGVYPIPGKSLPKAMLYMFGPLQGFSWKFIKRNVGIPIDFDNSYSKENLGIQYRDTEQSLRDHAEQVILDKLV